MFILKIALLEKGVERTAMQCEPTLRFSLRLDIG